MCIEWRSTIIPERAGFFFVRLVPVSGRFLYAVQNVKAFQNTFPVLFPDGQRDIPYKDHIADELFYCRHAHDEGTVYLDKVSGRQFLPHIGKRVCNDNGRTSACQMDVTIAARGFHPKDVIEADLVIELVLADKEAVVHRLSVNRSELRQQGLVTLDRMRMQVGIEILWRFKTGDLETFLEIFRQLDADQMKRIFEYYIFHNLMCINN